MQGSGPQNRPNQRVLTPLIEKAGMSREGVLEERPLRELPALGGTGDRGSAGAQNTSIWKWLPW